MKFLKLSEGHLKEKSNNRIWQLYGTLLLKHLAELQVAVVSLAALEGGKEVLGSEG